MEIRQIAPADRDQALMDALLPLWEASVRATHTFLSDGEIRRLADVVPQAVREVPLLAVAYDGGTPAGFLGVAGEKLEMLFLAPEYRGRGLGRELLQRGVQAWGVRSLDVNEQNPQARGFYEHMGFCVTGRRETDGQGQPYPILSMSLGQ